MKIHDISMSIHAEMAVYKDKPKKRPQIRQIRQLKDGANESFLGIESHTGTHMDAPSHMLDGAEKIHEMRLDQCIGKAIVVDFTDVKEKITEKDFDGMFNHNETDVDKTKNKKITIEKGSIVLLKTRKKPMESFDFNFTYLEKSGAKFLSKKGIKAVGIDQLGIERSQPDHATHKALMKKGIVIFEGLELSKIRPGKYFFAALPLKIKNGDGAPCRAILIEDFEGK